MTSIKVIREREEETRKLLDQHTLISAAYSALQQNYNDLQFSVRNISVEDRYSSITAVRTSASGKSRDILIVAATSAMEEREEVEEIFNTLKSDVEKPEELDIIGTSLIMFKPPSKEKKRILSLALSDFVWLYSESDSTLEIMGREEGPFEILSQGLTQIQIMDNYPHPYHYSLDPLIKFSFLSMNDTRSGKESLADVLNEAVDNSYSISIRVDREKIREDLLDLVHDMHRAGLITAHGNEIYFPRNMRRLRKSFIRKYWDYVEKIGKRTLFDFESPF